MIFTEARKKTKTYGETILLCMYQRSLLLYFFGALTVMINTVLDGAITGHFLGESATAAFGLILPVFSLMSLAAVLLRSTSQAQIGSCLGSGDVPGANRMLRSILNSGCFLAVFLFLAFSVFREGVLSLLGIGKETSPELAPMISGYLLYFSPSLFPLMICPVLHPLMQFDGDGKRSLYAILCATAVNLAGDLLAVVIFRSGIGGIALATTLSCYTELAVLLLHFRKKNAILHPFRSSVPGKKLTKEMISGIPATLREFTSFLAGISLNRLTLLTGGERALAVLAVGNAVFPFLLSAAIAIGGTGLSLEMVSKGEYDRHAVNTVFRTGLFCSLIGCSAFAGIFMFLAGPVAAFAAGSSPENAAAAAFFLRCLALSLPFTALCRVVESHLIVLDRPRLASALSIAGGGILLMGTARIMGAARGMTGIWLAYPVSATAVVFIILLWWKAEVFFRSRHGKEKKPFKDSTECRELETTVFSEEEAVDFSEQVRRFCIENSMAPRACNAAALSIEEMASNVIRWGYRDKKNAGVDLRVVYREGELLLRFRDNGRIFNPEQYVRQFAVSDEDPAKNCGLRLISKMVKKMEYVCLVDCNVVLIEL